jgi:hypothetical protein
LGYPVFQKHFDTARFSNRHIVIGSWVIGGVPAGINFREDSTDTTQDDSCFVPHYIRGEKKAVFDKAGAAAISGKHFTDRQKQLYKELYGMEIGKPPKSSSRWWGSGKSEWLPDEIPIYVPNGDRRSSRSGSGKNSGKGAAGTGERGGEHQKAAENFRQQSARSSSPKGRASSGTRATGASHSTMARAGMGGGRG